MDVRKKINKNKTMNYNCYWISANGTKNWEGTFRTLEETEEVIKLQRIEWSSEAVHPKRVLIDLPKEGHQSKDEFVKNPQYWTNTIQVHLGDHAFAFIFEPISKRYVIELEDAQKQTWLEEFLDDNKIDYIC